MTTIMIKGVSRLRGCTRYLSLTTFFSFLCNILLSVIPILILSCVPLRYLCLIPFLCLIFTTCHQFFLCLTSGGVSDLEAQRL
jgi:hypothetical protein